MTGIPCVIGIKIEGSPETLNKLIERSKDAPGILKAIGEALVPVAQERFDSKTTPEGSAWAANAPLTLMLSAGKGSMMKRSGRLRGSIHYNVSGTTLQLGPNTVYAAAQNFGAVIRGKNGPLRIPVPAGTPMSRKQADDLGVGRKKSRGTTDGDVRRSNADTAIYVDHVTIPARKYIGIGRKDHHAIADTLEAWFSDK